MAFFFGALLLAAMAGCKEPHGTAETAIKASGTRGEKSGEGGGVNRLNVTPAVDPKSSVFGGYDREVVEAIKVHWYRLWENRNWDSSGKVVLEFRLKADGTITSVKVIKNEVTDFMESICERAVLDAQPYSKWPEEMRLETPAGYRDLQFTFYYDVR